MAKSESSSDETAQADEPTGDAKTTKAAKSTKAGKATKTATTAKGTSGDPSKRASTTLSKRAERRIFDDPVAARRVTPRAVLALLLVVAGIAWIAYYYVAVRADPLSGAEPTGPGFIGDLADWNYLIGFAAFFLGLVVAAHPSTPLGRGRGVVTGMLFCFLFGLAWICTFYAITANPDALPVFDDLGQKNLFVGIASMGVGFVYATRWE